MNQRMKWDAEAAFKRIEAFGGVADLAAANDAERMKAPYTPPPNVAAWLKAQADKPKTRDYDAILRAAKKAPVGYYEDAPTGIKFGGQPLPSAGHGKDVDGPWPKCVNWFGIAVYVFAGPAKNQGLYHRDDGTTDRAAGDYADRLRNGGVSMSTPEASQWLEQNGHKDAAAQLRGDDVATGGGRVWKTPGTKGRVFVCGKMFNVFAHGAHPSSMTVGEMERLAGHNEDHAELFGTERDAIIAECRKAMGL